MLTYDSISQKVILNCSVHIDNCCYFMVSQIKQMYLGTIN